MDYGTQRQTLQSEKCTSLAFASGLHIYMTLRKEGAVTVYFWVFGERKYNSVRTIDHDSRVTLLMIIMF